MFKISTAIVLGAGASYSYGYPTGTDLVQELIDKTRPTKKRPAIRNPSDDYKDPSDRLHLALNFYSPLSIDSFLQHYEHDDDLIKAAKHHIASILLTKDNSTLFSHGAKLEDKHTHWYRFLWDAIVSEHTAEELATPDRDLKFDIITFNYDNSLEYFLANCVYSPLSTFTDEQKPKVISNLSTCIHHVYGSLEENYFSLIRKNRPPIISFPGKGNDFTVALKSSQQAGNIQLISERGSGDFKKFQEIIRNALQVIFLGFGFDETNIGPNVLDLKNVLRARPSQFSLPISHTPVVKYTNLGDSEIINRRLASILHQREEPVDSRGYGFVTRDSNDSIFKSTKDVYRALAEDFSLTYF